MRCYGLGRRQNRKSGNLEERADGGRCRELFAALLLLLMVVLVEADVLRDEAGRIVEVAREHGRRYLDAPAALLVLLLVAAPLDLGRRDDLAALDQLAALALAVAVLAVALVALHLRDAPVVAAPRAVGVALRLRLVT